MQEDIDIFIRYKEYLKRTLSLLIIHILFYHR